MVRNTEKPKNNPRRCTVPPQTGIEPDNQTPTQPEGGGNNNSSQEPKAGNAVEMEME